MFDDSAHSTDNHDPGPPEAGEDAPHAITVSEAGRRGGRRTREKYGPDFYRQIGKKGGQALAEERGAEYYSELGKKGGAIVRERHGPMYFSEIGQKGGKALKKRADPEYYSKIGRLGGTSPHRTRRFKAGLPPKDESSGGPEYPVPTGKTKRIGGQKPLTEPGEAHLPLAEERQAMLAALPPTTHVSFRQHQSAPGRQTYWYASWLDRQTKKVCTLYLGKTPPAEHPCKQGQCNHPFRHGKPKPEPHPLGRRLGYQPSAETIARQRQAHLGKSNRSRKAP